MVSTCNQSDITKSNLITSSDAVNIPFADAQKLAPPTSSHQQAKVSAILPLKLSIQQTPLVGGNLRVS